MDERTFKRFMLAADMLLKPARPEFWRGYVRGLRRLYHGAAFGTDAEHEAWMRCGGDREAGYRAGLTGKAPDECMT